MNTPTTEPSVPRLSELLTSLSRADRKALAFNLVGHKTPEGDKVVRKLEDRLIKS